MQRMTRKGFLKAGAAGLAAWSQGIGAKAAEELKPIALPPPRKDRGKPFMAVVNLRQTIREYTDQPLSREQLSDLLWAAFGINRKQGPLGRPGRTAPSAVNAQEIDVYVALPEGVYLYDAVEHSLKPVVAGDYRGKTGPAAAAIAAVTLIYVADPSRFGSIVDENTRLTWSHVDVGFIGQNVYLWAASEGLGAWFRAMIPAREELAKALKLSPSQRLLYVQTVGYPAKK